MLRRLLRAAATREEQMPAMPFGFDTRVLAQLRSGAGNGSAFIGLFARRASALSLAVLVAAGAGVYLSSAGDFSSDVSSAYEMADSAIQSDLGE
jgi:hypothetical protein